MHNDNKIGQPYKRKPSYPAHAVDGCKLEPWVIYIMPNDNEP